MKVLVVLTGGIRADGITSVWLTYCKEILKQGLTNCLKLDFAAIDGISEQQKVKQFCDIGINVVYLPNRLKSPIKYLYGLNHALKKGRYDAIHANGSSSLMCIEMLAGKISNVPVRISHSRNTECSYRILNKLLRPLFLRLCTARFACGIDAGKWLFGKKDFVVINNGKDFAKFHFSQEKREWVRSKLKLDGKFVIGHVGWFTKIKNQSFLIDIFAEFVKIVPNSILYLMGTGEMLEEIKGKVSCLGLMEHVIFAGLVEDMPDRLQGMDLMVLPSLHEGLPNVVLEWQALGLPCLLSDSITRACAVSDLVEFDNLNKSPKEWALHLKNIYDIKRDRLFSAKNATENLQKAGFDIVENVKFLYHQYDSLINKKI